MITMQFAGYVGKTAEVRRQQNGDEVATFSVGVSTGKDKTTWVSCAIYGDRAAKLTPHITKGKFVACTGFPSARAWQPNGGGDPRADLQCAIDRLTFGPAGKSDGDDRREASKPAAGGRDDLNDDIDSIPF